MIEGDAGIGRGRRCRRSFFIYLCNHSKIGKTYSNGHLSPPLYDHQILHYPLWMNLHSFIQLLRPLLQLLLTRLITQILRNHRTRIGLMVLDGGFGSTFAVERVRRGGRVFGLLCDLVGQVYMYTSTALVFACVSGECCGGEERRGGVYALLPASSSLG